MKVAVHSVDIGNSRKELVSCIRGVYIIAFYKIDTYLLTYLKRQSQNALFLNLVLFLGTNS